MEIRGAGELLGAEQSGQIEEVGFSLYTDMLARAVRALQQGREPDLDAPVHRGIDIELHVAALIPESYLADVPARLTWYKRIASAGDRNALRELQVEMIDRFGLLPEPVRNLFAIAELRQMAETIGVTRLVLSAQGGRIEFAAGATADPRAVIALVESEPLLYRLDGPQALRILGRHDDAAGRFETAHSLLRRLAGDAEAASLH